MKKNMGMIDRMIRIAIVVIIGILWFFNLISGNLAAVLLSVSGIFLITGLLGFCPVYYPFGIKTCSKQCNCKSETNQK